MKDEKGRYRRRIHHYDEPFEAHELTFCCLRRQSFLSQERACNYLAEALVGARRRHGFHLWAYVFMPEHVHLVVWPAEAGARVEGFLKAVKQSVARRAVADLRQADPEELRRLATGDRRHPYAFWQDGPGYDRNLLGGTLRAAVDYIHANPVRRGLASHEEAWRWSSARDWHGLGAGPVALDLDSYPSG